MKIIGITGGIGSGKSTVSRILADLGVKVIDSDIVAREVVSKGEKALDEIIGYFGSEILSQSGEIDRKKLGEIVFKNSEKLKVLNEITHKYIIQRITNTLNEIQQSDIKVAAVEATIPVANGFIDIVDEVWAVIADYQTRIKRVMQRSGLTYEEALSRINSQMKDEEYTKIADEVILNNSGISQLEKIVGNLLNKKDQGDSSA